MHQFKVHFCNGACLSPTESADFQQSKGDAIRIFRGVPIRFGDPTIILSCAPLNFL